MRLTKAGHQALVYLPHMLLSTCPWSKKSAENSVDLLVVLFPVSLLFQSNISSLYFFIQSVEL